jgi:predicted metal-dependent phosphoesterase TrpH
MAIYRADLHLHTVLSSCAEVEMIPPLIIESVVRKDIDIIAITDHNASGNVAAVMDAAKNSGVHVFPGMELQVREEVDVLCLFDTIEQVVQWQRLVDGWLLPLENDADRFGKQFLVDAEGDFIAEDTRLLQAPTTVGIEQAEVLIHEIGGLVIPAHIDRAQGYMTVLGLWSESINVDAVEVSTNLHPKQAYEKYNIPAGLAVISNSDAHWLDWIGQAITIYEFNEPPSITAIRKAMQGESGFCLHVP